MCIYWCGGEYRVALLLLKDACIRRCHPWWWAAQRGQCTRTARRETARGRKRHSQPCLAIVHLSRLTSAPAMPIFATAGRHGIRICLCNSHSHRLTVHGQPALDVGKDCGKEPGCAVRSQKRAPRPSPSTATTHLMICTRPLSSGKFASRMPNSCCSWFLNCRLAQCQRAAHGARLCLGSHTHRPKGAHAEALDVEDHKVVINDNLLERLVIRRPGFASLLPGQLCAHGISALHGILEHERKKVDDAFGCRVHKDVIDFEVAEVLDKDRPVVPVSLMEVCE